jgi:hypothetical protein
MLIMCVLEKVSIEFMRCLARNIFVHQMKMIHPDCLILVNDVDFLECLIVSIVCIKNEKNYPTTWKEMYCDYVKEPIVILHAVTSNDLWRTNCYTTCSHV